MNWFFGIASYLIIWWLVIFAVLPFGVKAAEEGDPGYAAGAPAHPHLAVKAAATTVVAAVIWLLLFWAVREGLFDFRGVT